MALVIYISIFHGGCIIRKSKGERLKVNLNQYGESRAQVLQVWGEEEGGKEVTVCWCLR